MFAILYLTKGGSRMISNFDIELHIDASLGKHQINIHSPNDKEGKQIEYKIITALQEEPNNKIAFKDGDEYHVLAIEEIIYAEVYQGKLTIYTIDNKITSRQTLKSLQEKMSKADYLQISKSAIVQIEAIQKLEVAFSGNYYAFLKNNMKITVSRRFVNDLKDHLGIN